VERNRESCGGIVHTGGSGKENQRGQWGERKEVVEGGHESLLRKKTNQRGDKDEWFMKKKTQCVD